MMAEHKKLIPDFIGGTQNSVSSKSLKETGPAYSFSIPKNNCPKDVYKGIYATSFIQMNKGFG